MIAPVSAKPVEYQPLPITDFGYGLQTKSPPNKIPHGAALVSLNCDYNARTIMNRRGYASVLENGPGAAYICNFEVAEASSGGSADTAHFVQTEAAADGTQSHQFTAVGGGAEVSFRQTPIGSPLNLGANLKDVIHCWLYCWALPATITGYTMTIRFETTVNDYWLITVSSNTDLVNFFEAAVGRYHRFRKQDCTAVGSPDWTSIATVRFGLTATGTGNLQISVDNLHSTPGVMQALFQFRRQVGAEQGAIGEYAIAGGSLYVRGASRWTLVRSGFTPDVPVYHHVAQDKALLSDGITSPQWLQSDGATVYRLGIVTPPRTIQAQQIGGGFASDGDYYLMVLFYSSKTGTFSAPDQRTPNLANKLDSNGKVVLTPDGNPVQVPVPDITISNGNGTAGIRVTNIPVSSDPQVDWVIIGIRPAAVEPTSFFRASDGLFGEVANGTTSFNWVESVSTLQARASTAIDEDMDYPSVIDPTTLLPVEGHPIYLEEAGGYIWAVMAERPSVVRVSRFRAPGSWAIDDEFPVGENDSDPVTGIRNIGSAVAVMKRTAVYPGRVVGGDQKISIDPPMSDRGSISHRAMILSNNVLWYKSQDGMYWMRNDFIPHKATENQQPTWNALWDPAAQGLEVMAQIRDTEQVIAFGRSLGAVANDTGWVTHFRTTPADPETGLRWPEWAPTLWNMPADVAEEVRRTTVQGSGWEVWTGGKGQVWRINYGIEDDHRPIESTHRTPLISGVDEEGDPNPNKSHLWSWIDIEGLPAGSVTMDVRVFLGQVQLVDATLAASLQGGSAPLGTFVLGTSKLGAPTYFPQRIRVPRIVARYLMIELHFRGRGNVQVWSIKPWSTPMSEWREFT